MRINHGEFAGKRLIAPKSTLTRPTSDKVRQAIFNIIEHHIDMPALKDSTVLDVFAGTGALGLEALSRGAAHVIFVDNQRDAVLNLHNTATQWKIKERVHILEQDVLAFYRSAKPVDFIFCDPPYRQELVNLAINRLYKDGWLTLSTVVVAEMYKRDDLQLSFATQTLQEKRYGDTKVIFFKVMDKA